MIASNQERSIQAMMNEDPSPMMEWGRPTRVINGDDPFTVIPRHSPLRYGQDRELSSCQFWQNGALGAVRGRFFYRWNS